MEKISLDLEEEKETESDRLAEGIDRLMDRIDTDR